MYTTLKRLDGTRTRREQALRRATRATNLDLASLFSLVQSGVIAREQ